MSWRCRSQQFVQLAGRLLCCCRSSLNPPPINPSTRHPRPPSPRPSRCLHLLSYDDDDFKSDARRLGLVRLLVQQLRHDTHWMDEPPAPAAAAILVAGRAAQGSSPHGSVPGSPRAGPGGAAAAAAASGAAAAVAAAAAGPAPGTPFHEVSIPEDEELPSAMFAAGSSPTHRHMLGRQFSLLAPRQGSEAAPLRAFGGGPTPLQRLAAAALLRAALVPVMSPSSVGVLTHGALLPALLMQQVGPRLSLSMEATATLKALMVGSPENQDAALAGGAVRCLSKVWASWT